MKYSLIVPVYNVAQYLPKFAQTVLPQIPADAQVILVDDGSTDESGKLCDRYAEEYPQVQVIHKENGGVATARNAGLNAAEGEYLLWADPDDWVADNWFRTLSETIDREQPDILHFDYAEWEFERALPVPYGRTPGEMDKMEYLMDVVRDVRVNNSLWSRVFRRELFDGLHFDDSLRCLEDYALMHHLILRAKKIVYLPQVLYFYTIRGDGLVRAPNMRVSCQSFQVAVHRREELSHLPQTSNMGVIVQARGFCRNYYLAGEPAEFRDTYRACRAELLTHWREYLSDPELSWKVRAKTLLASSRVVGWLYTAIKKRSF